MNKIGESQPIHDELNQIGSDPHYNHYYYKRMNHMRVTLFQLFQLATAHSEYLVAVDRISLDGRMRNIKVAFSTMFGHI